MKIIKNKPWQIFKTIFLILFLIFIINHYSIKNGYNEKQINNKTIITQENIEEFEKDIKNKEYIDLKNYNNSKTINTNNTITKIGYKTSEIINNFITKRTKDIYEILKSLFS